MSCDVDLPTLEDAASLLVAASVIEVDTDRGGHLALWTISHAGVVVSASGPRLAVAQGMQLRCRALTATGPVIVCGVIEEAEYRSAARASLTLRVTHVRRENELQRGSERVALATSATLRALICDRIVPDELLAVTLVDVSQTGCGVTTSDARVRVRDPLWLSARFLEGEVATDIRVARVSKHHDTLTVGGVFLDPGPSPAVLDAVLTRLRGRG
jgi:hypothetical protein